MRTNTQFAIAIHALTLIAQARGEPVTSAQVASSVNTHAVFVRRILGQLRAAGLVESEPGAHGGWRLRAAPEAMTLLAIYQAVDGERLLARHARPNLACPVGAAMPAALEQCFAEAERAFTGALAGRTLADVERVVVSGG